MIPDTFTFLPAIRCHFCGLRGDKLQVTKTTCCLLVNAEFTLDATQRFYRVHSFIIDCQFPLTSQLATIIPYTTATNWKAFFSETCKAS